jgi:hypothetical protein
MHISATNAIGIDYTIKQQVTSTGAREKTAARQKTEKLREED